MLHAEPVRLTRLNPRVPVELEPIVSKMLSKRPQDRYATAADLLVDLRRLERGQQGRPLEPRRPWARRRWAAAGVLVVALAAAWFTPPVQEWVLCAVGYCPVPAEKNLVVLPFRVIGEGQDQFYCDGLTDTVTAKMTQLTLSPGLQVSPARDVWERGVSTVEEARTKLGANLVVEASWQRSGEQARINLVLVDAREKQQLRSDTVTEAITDPFALQDRVVRSVARMLELQLRPEQANVLAAHGTSVPTANDFYLQGRGYLRNYDKPENIENAIHLFDKAVALDPDYGLAYAGLGSAYWKKYEATKEARWVEKGQQACQRAVAEDSELAEGHICLGTLYNGTGKYQEAAGEFQRALESQPTSDDAYRGLAAAYESLGRLAEAERTYQRAIQVRPNYWAGYSWLGSFYYKQGRYAEAAEVFQQVVTLAPDNARGYSNLGAMYYLQGKTDEAIAAYEKSLAIRPNFRAASNLGTFYFYHRQDYARAAKAYEQALELNDSQYELWGFLGGARQRLGDREGARQAYAKAMKLAEAERALNPHDPQVLLDLAHYNLSLGQPEKAGRLLEQAASRAPEDAGFFFQTAVVYERLGQRAQALAWLEKAIEKGYPWEEVERTPGLRELRSDPRFEKLQTGK